MVQKSIPNNHRLDGGCKKTLQTDGINDLYLNWFSRQLLLHRPTSTELDGLKNPMDGCLDGITPRITSPFGGCLVTIFSRAITIFKPFISGDIYFLFSPLPMYIVYIYIFNYIHHQDKSYKFLIGQGLNNFKQWSNPFPLESYTMFGLLVLAAPFPPRTKYIVL